MLNPQRLFLMNATIKPLSSPENLPLLPTIDVVTAIGNPVRWLILAELASGEPLLVNEIAARIKKSPSLVSKHLAVLRKAGLVQVGHAHCYEIPQHFPVTPEKRHVDFGHCVLRLPATVIAQP